LSTDPLILSENAVRLPREATDEEILALVGQWVELLAQGNYGAAYDVTAHEPYYQWTPELMRQTIEGYGFAEPHPAGPFRITSFASAKGGPKPRHRVERFETAQEDGRIGYVLFDLPLNGQWSDLTATFGVYRYEDRVVLSLNEIHVF